MDPRIFPSEDVPQNLAVWRTDGQTFHSFRISDEFPKKVEKGVYKPFEKVQYTASVLGRALKLKKKSRRELDIGAVRC